MCFWCLDDVSGMERKTRLDDWECVVIVEDSRGEEKERAK